MKKKVIIAIVLIVLGVLVGVGGSYYYFVVRDNNSSKSSNSDDSSEKVEEERAELSLTDSSFSNTLDALSQFTYEQSRENGYSSFSSFEFLQIVAKDLTDTDFTYLGEQMISGWNRKVYQLSYQTLIDKLKQYFSSDVEFDANTLVDSNGGAILPNVHFEEGSGMVISSYDSENGTYQVYFGGVGGTSGPGPQITERKVTEAYRLGDHVYVTERAIYYTSVSPDYTNFTYSIYSHPGETDLIDTLVFNVEDITSQSISVDNYLDSAATISYVFSKDSESGNYVFSSSKIS